MTLGLTYNLAPRGMAWLIGRHFETENVVSLRVGRKFVWLDDRSIAFNKIVSVEVDERVKPASMGWIGWVGAAILAMLTAGIHPVLYLLPAVSIAIAGLSFYTAAPQTFYYLSVETISASTIEAVTTELEQVRRLQSVVIKADPVS